MQDYEYDNERDIIWLKDLRDTLSRFRIVHGVMPYDPIFTTIQFVEAALYRCEHREEYGIKQ